MTELLFYVAILFSALYAASNWRGGLYLCLVFDVLRDPVRKLSESHSVAITVAGASMWVAVAVGAYLAHGSRTFSLSRVYPRIQAAFLLLMLGMLPAALMSTVLYPGGYRMAAVGMVSYTAPFLGMGLGFLYLKRQEDLLKLMAFYCVINGLALSGTLFEFFEMDVPALGGINVVWLRYKPGYVVKLISGFYRSPDVMGLHAAFVATFGVVLAMHSRSNLRALWFALTIWGTTCLVLSGRRKMIAMLLVFVVAFVWLKLRQGGASALATILVTVAVVLGGAYVLMKQVEVGAEYVEYAGTTIGDAGERLRTNVFDASLETAETAGVFGHGLGVATQGSYYLGAHGKRVWQEDGVSRVFAEVGWLGAVLFGATAAQLLACFVLCLRRVMPRRDIGDVMFGIVGIVAACVGSFIVSHQAFSGDPAALMMTSFLVGCFFTGPMLPGSFPLVPRAELRPVLAMERATAP